MTEISDLTLRVDANEFDIQRNNSFIVINQAELSDLNLLVTVSVQDFDLLKQETNTTLLSHDSRLDQLEGDVSSLGLGSSSNLATLTARIDQVILDLASVEANSNSADAVLGNNIIAIEEDMITLRVADIEALGDRVTANESSITLLDDSITLKVTEAVSAYGEQVTLNESQISLLSDSILLEVSSREALESVVNTHSSSINILDNSITAEVTARETLGDLVTVSSSKIALMEDQISLAVSDIAQNGAGIISSNSEISLLSDSITLAVSSIDEVSNRVAATEIILGPDGIELTALKEFMNGDHTIQTTQTILANQWSVVIEEDVNGNTYASGFKLIQEISWVEDYAYVVGDTVYYEEAVYECILDSTGDLPTDETYWQLKPDGVRSEFVVQAEDFKILTPDGVEPVFQVSEGVTTISNDLYVVNLTSTTYPDPDLPFFHLDPETGVAEFNKMSFTISGSLADFLSNEEALYLGLREEADHFEIPFISATFTFFEVGAFNTRMHNDIHQFVFDSLDCSFTANDTMELDIISGRYGHRISWSPYTGWDTTNTYADTSFSGSECRKVQVKIKRLTGTDFDGKATWITLGSDGNPDFTSYHSHTISWPSGVANDEWTILEWDFSDPSFIYSGQEDNYLWVGNTICGFYLQLNYETDPDTTWEIEWIKVIGSEPVETSGNIVQDALDNGVDISGAMVDGTTFISGGLVNTDLLLVDTAQIADAAITNAKIDDLAVDTAQIEDAAITTAKITDLSVSTLKIGNNAVTVPSAVYSSTAITADGLNTDQLLAEVTITLDASAFLMGQFFTNVGRTGTPSNWSFDMKVGTVLMAHHWMGTGEDSSVSFAGSTLVSSGTHTVKIYAKTNSTNLEFNYRSLIVQGVKK